MGILLRIGSVLAAAYVAAACTFSAPLNELNETRPPLPPLKKLVMFEPSIKIYSLGMDGRKSLDEAAVTVKRKLRSEIANRMQAAGYLVEHFKPRSATEKHAEEQLVKLHYAIANAKMLHAFPPNSLVDQVPVRLPTISRDTAFPTPAPARDIAPDIVERHDAKFGIIVNGYDEQTTGGVKAAQFFAVLLAGGQALQPTFFTISFSIIDLKTGEEIWSHAEQSTARDITDDLGLGETLSSAFESLKEARNKRKAEGAT